MEFRTRAACLGLAMLVSACGGGGGGGVPDPFQPPSATASINPSRVTFSATATDTDAPVTQLAVSLAHASTGPFLVIGSGSSVVEASASGNIVTVRGVSPSNLPPGNYADNLTVNVCLDDQCTHVAANSPLQVPVLYTVLPGNPALMTPRLATMSPGIVVQGGPGFTLEVQGDDFAPTTLVLWNGQPLPTTYVSRKTIQAQVPASDVAAIGRGAVSLSNASTGGGVSASLSLEIIGPTPTLSSLVPPTAAVGGSGYTLIINGTGFDPQTQVTWNGTQRAATYVSPTQLTTNISAADIAAAGSFPVRVYDNVFFQSDPLAVTVSPAALAVTSLSPPFVTVGAPAYAQTVNGSGFGASSIVQWNGSARPTTFVSTTELRATVSASDIAGAGSASVTVINGGTTPVTSNARTLAIGTSSADATSYDIDPQHDGAMHFNAIVPPSAFPLSPAWTATLDGQVSYPLIAGGRVFVTVTLPEGGSRLYALGAADGAVAWGPVSFGGRASAAYDHGRLIVLAKTGSHGRLAAFDALTGTPSWTRDLSGLDSDFAGAPTAMNGMVYVPGSGGVAAFDDTSGAALWSGAAGGTGQGSPTVTSSGVFVSTPCTTTVFAPATGTRLWSDNTGCSGGGGATGAFGSGMYYSPIEDPRGKVFNASTGAALGTFQSSGPPALGSSIGYFLQSGHLLAVNLTAGGGVRWTFDGGGNLISVPIVVNDYVFESDVAGTLYALDASTGAVLWRTALGAMVNYSPGDLGAGAVAAGGGLLLLPVGRTLTAYTLSDNP